MNHDTNPHGQATTIVATHLALSYPKKDVLNNVSFTLDGPGIYGLIGPNGVGKTTLLSAIGGQFPVFSSAEGTARAHNRATATTTPPLTVGGVEPFDNRGVLDRTVLTGIDIPLPDNWKGTKILSTAALRWDTWDQERATELTERFGADLHTPLEKLSRGQRSMIHIIVALAARCPITLLDEPTLGLDPDRQRIFYDVMREETELLERVFIVSTHHLAEAEPILDTIIILADGGCPLYTPISELSDRFVLATGSSRAIEEFTRRVAPFNVKAERTTAGMSTVIVDAAQRGASHITPPAETSDNADASQYSPAPSQQAVEQIWSIARECGLSPKTPSLSDVYSLYSGYVAADGTAPSTSRKAADSTDTAESKETERDEGASA